MNQLTTEKRARVVAALIEGCSIRSTSRLTGVSKTTILKLILDLGVACDRYQREHLVGLKSKRVQADEIWSFCYAKNKNVPADMRGQHGVGDVWTWTAIDADSKLIISWLVGRRDYYYATAFMQDVASRLANRVQLTTDGHKVYVQAVEDAFGSEIDYAMLQKIYGSLPEATIRYSPAQIVGITADTITGDPAPEHVSTSFAERMNLTIRMTLRRYGRLTNAFSKKIEYHEAAVAMNFFAYNFCRIHGKLRVTPAMEAGVTDHLWSLEDMVGLLG